MTFPYALPDWLPWWAPMIVLVVVLLWVLAFLLVPFSVIGVKSRLDGMEARLDEIQAEIRTLALRLPESGRPVEFDDMYAAPPAPASARMTSLTRPPIPPAAHQLNEDRPLSVPPPSSAAIPRPRRPDSRDAPREPRSEPRLDWPR